MTRLRSLARPITSMIAAGAIFLASLGASATPAAADRDIGRFIAGAIALGIIAHGLSNSGPSHRTQTYHYQHRPSNILPGYCRVQVRQHGHPRAAYDPQCLRHAGLHRLPRNCQFSVHTRHGWQHYMGERCLVQAGYRVERGGHRW